MVAGVVIFDMMFCPAVLNCDVRIFRAGER
jgi:hypothetical protein